MIWAFVTIMLLAVAVISPRFFLYLIMVPTVGVAIGGLSWGLTAMVMPMPVIPTFSICIAIGIGVSFLVAVFDRSLV